MLSPSKHERTVTTPLLGRMRLRSLKLVTITALLAGCSSGVPVAVSNHSAIPLRNVVLSGSGFSQAVTTLAPGATATAQIHPRGESGIAIAFTADSRRIELPQQGYIEVSGNYSATVTVNPDLSASVVGQLGLR